MASKRPRTHYDNLQVARNASPEVIKAAYRGLSQRALAARAGLNFTYLSQLETCARKGTTATMKKLAEALGVDLDDVT